MKLGFELRIAVPPDPCSSHWSQSSLEDRAGIHSLQLSRCPSAIDWMRPSKIYIEIEPLICWYLGDGGRGSGAFVNRVSAPLKDTHN